MMADSVLQDAIQESYNYPNTFSEVINVKFIVNEYGEARVNRIVNIRHNYYGGRDNRSCDNTKYIPVRHNVDINSLRNDLVVSLPGSITSKIKEGSRVVDVKAFVKFRIEQAKYRFKSSVKIIKHAAVLEELAFYDNDPDDPFKVFREHEVY